MKKETTPLRLIYPQWQGGIVDHWMPDIPAEDSSRGYYLGAQLLNCWLRTAIRKPWKFRYLSI